MPVIRHSERSEESTLSVIAIRLWRRSNPAIRMRFSSSVPSLDRHGACSRLAMTNATI